MTVLNTSKLWISTLAQLTINSNLEKEIYQNLVNLYNQSSRFYHTLNHIENMISDFERYVCNFQFDHTTRNAISFSIIFHDVIYDSKAKNNEEKSAEYARESLIKLGVDENIINIVESFILCTKYHQPDVVESLLLAASFFLDLDLLILGKNKSEYKIYAEQIQQEYAWIPKDIYKEERIKILHKFLWRPKLFFSSIFQEKFEIQARENINWEINLLR